VDIKEQAKKDRLQLIDTIQSKVSQINTRDLTSLLAMEFFTFPEEFAKAQREVTQARNEFVIGLLSSKPIVEGGRFPTSEDLNEIRQLFQKLFLTYFYENLPTKTASESYIFQDIEEAGSAFFTLAYFAVIRGEGYPDQLWNAAIETYSPHNDYLKTKLGFTIEQAVDIFKWLYKTIESKANKHAQDFVAIMTPSMTIWQEWHRGKVSTDSMLSKVDKIDKAALSEQVILHNKRTKDVFTFKIQEIEDRFGKEFVQAFMKRFASSFGEMNKAYSEPTQFNEIYRTPLLRISENEVFIPIPPLLCQIPAITLHYDLIQDPAYEPQYVEVRGKYLEKKACNLLGTIFGAVDFYTNLHFTDHNGNEGEIDLLFTFDNKLIIVECKSKSLTLPAKQGNLGQISKDFSDAIQRAYDQNKKAVNYINACDKAEFYRKDGKRIVIEREKIREIFSVIITANTFAALTSDLSVFLKKDPNDPYPWAVCLRDLEVITEYLYDPYLFIHFLKRRLILHGRVLSPDEMEYVGCYLNQGLYFEEELKKSYHLLLVGFTEQFDAAELKKIGKLKTAQVGTSWSNPAFENLIGTIKILNGYGHSDIILTLLDADSQSRDNLIKFIKETIERTTKDHSGHDFSMLFDDFGFSFISDTRRDNLATKVQVYGELKKYKHKAKIWLAMGRDASDTRYLVNEYAYLDYEWRFDLIMEERIKKYLGSGTRIKID
jgi:hypothetical protein